MYEASQEKKKDSMAEHPGTTKTITIGLGDESTVIAYEASMKGEG